MLVRNDEESKKCKELKIAITHDKIICKILVKTMGFPDFEKIAEESNNVAFAIMGDQNNPTTGQYFLLSCAVVKGKVYYQALSCFDIKTTGLSAYCYIQELKERMLKDTAEMKGDAKKFDTPQDMMVDLGGKLEKAKNRDENKKTN